MPEEDSTSARTQRCVRRIEVNRASLRSDKNS